MRRCAMICYAMLCYVMSCMYVGCVCTLRMFVCDVCNVCKLLCVYVMDDKDVCVYDMFFYTHVCYGWYVSMVCRCAVYVCMIGRRCMYALHLRYVSMERMYVCMYVM